MTTNNDKPNDNTDEQFVAPESDPDAGQNGAPSPDPRDEKQPADESPLMPEPGNDAPEGDPAPPPESEGGRTDAIHLEDDRIR